MVILPYFLRWTKVISKIVEADIEFLLLRFANEMKIKTRTFVISGREDIVEMLIAKGAGLDYKDNDGNTPLHLATQSGK